MLVKHLFVSSLTDSLIVSVLFTGIWICGWKLKWEVNRYMEDKKINEKEDSKEKVRF